MIYKIFVSLSLKLNFPPNALVTTVVSKFRAWLMLMSQLAEARGPMNTDLPEQCENGGHDGIGDWSLELEFAF